MSYRELLHLTLNTGHVRQSPRAEVADDVIALLRPLVRSGGGPIPWAGPGYVVQIWRTGRDALFTVARRDDDYPVLTCGLGVDEPGAGVGAPAHAGASGREAGDG